MSNSFDERAATVASTDPTTDQAQRRLSNLLTRVPGYKGYRDKEDRRDADRAVRDEVAGGLDAAAERVERVARDLANRRRYGEVSTVDEWVQALRHLANRIRNATYGYGGLFSQRDIDAEALDRLYQSDESLLAELQRLENPIGALEAAAVADGDLSAATRAGLEVTRRLATRFETRGSATSGETPTPQPEMRDILSPATEPGPPAAWHLDAGDALTILGEDFLVDARVHVESDQATFRLFRLGERGDKRWLLVPADRTEPPALLQEADSDYTADSASSTSGAGRSQLVGPDGASGMRTVTYTLSSYASGEKEQRWISLEWPQDKMAWKGTTLDDEDITIFGSPNSRA